MKLLFIRQHYQQLISHSPLLNYYIFLINLFIILIMLKYVILIIDLMHVIKQLIMKQFSIHQL